MLNVSILFVIDNYLVTGLHPEDSVQPAYNDSTMCTPTTYPLPYTITSRYSFGRQCLGDQSTL